MSWATGSYNYLSYFMIKGIDATDGYYDLSLWETITIKFTLTGTNNGIRVRMKDNTAGDGDWIPLESAGEHTLNITDFKKNGVALNYSKIAGIQLSGGDNVTNASTATFTEISLYCEDLTVKARTNLTNLITLAEKYPSLGKTEASFNALTSQITTAKVVKDNVSATVEQLVSAKTALQDKIDALQLLPGYTNLTLDMYKTWEVKDDKIVEKEAGPGTIRLFEALSSGDVPYGNMYGSGNWENFAELSNYSKLYITGTAGERIRGYFNKSPEGTGIIDLTKEFDENGVAEFDFVSSPFNAADYIHLIFLKCPDANSGITSLLLYDGKHELKDAVTKASWQNSFAKTDESFAALGTAITSANAVINNRTASDENITTAKNNLNNALNNLQLLDGYTNLTTAMFKTWDSATQPTTSSIAYPYYSINQSTGQPYGDGNVSYLLYADLSEYNSMFILAPSGTPRVLMNRENNGNYNATEEKSKMIEFPKTGEWTDRYYSVNGTKFTYDLAKIASDKSFAHLNAIKGYNYGKVTVTDMLLYRTITVGSAGYSTFGSLDKDVQLKGVKGYAAKLSGNKVILSEVTTVPKGKGVVIEATEGSYAPTFDVVADDIDSDLKVSNGTVTGGSTIYALSDGSQGIGFYQVDSSVTIPAGKAYLVITGSLSRKFIGFDDNSVTDVVSVKRSSVRDNVYYDLQGRRVVQPKKGVYVRNGKKLFVK